MNPPDNQTPGNPPDNQTPGVPAVPPPAMPAPPQLAPAAAPTPPVPVTESIFPAPAAGTTASDLAVLKQLHRSTRRSFLLAGGAALAGVGGWWWLRSLDPMDGIPWPLRRVLQFNEKIGRTLFQKTHLAPTFAPNQAAVGADMRVNGDIGLEDPVTANWHMEVTHPDGRPTRRFGLGHLAKLNRSKAVTELKCIEGWSQVISWSGVTLLDFLVAYNLGTRSGAAPDPVQHPEDLYRYLGLETPNGEYYVGLDIESALHPQTLLCDQMGGEPLTLEHGAPLRLVIPVKYGIKNMKRIGLLRFSDEKPRDYWAERGYDWYSGL